MKSSMPNASREPRSSSASIAVHGRIVDSGSTVAPTAHQKGDLKILIVDGQKFVREGIQRLLAPCDDIRVTGEAVDAETATHKVRELKPDIVLLEVRLKNSVDGFQICRLLKRSVSGLKVILMAGDDAALHLHRVKGSGADGFIDKTCARTHLPSIVRQVFHGGFAVSAELSERAWDAFVTWELARGMALGDKANEHHHKLLSLLGAKKSNKEIASELGKSSSRVANMLTKLYRELGVKNRQEAVQKWRKARG